MDDSSRAKRTRRNRRSDLTVALWGATPGALENVELDKVKDLVGALPGPSGKVIGSTRSAWKEIQEALGRGSRRIGVEQAIEILGTLASSDGTLTHDSVEGAKDAVLGYEPRRTGQDYFQAYRKMLRATSRPPMDHATYPRTEDGFRGGLIAGTAVTYADVTGDPMLGRVQRAVLKSKTAKWNPGSVVFGSGASLAGSILDAVKHITESATDEAQAASDQVREVRGSIETWVSLLGRLGGTTESPGPDGAIGAAKRAISHAEDAARLIQDASESLKDWERDL